MAEEVRTTEDIFGDVRTTGEIFEPEEPEEPALFGKKIFIPKEPSPYRDQMVKLGRVMEGEDVESLLPFEERYQMAEIIGLAPQEEKDRMANTIYYSAKYDISPRITDALLDEMIKERFEGMSQSAVRKKLAEEYAEFQQQYLKTELKPFSLFGNALAQSLAGKPAMALRGAQVYTPGEALGLDSLLRQASGYLESLKKEKTTAEIEKAAAGRLWPAYKGKWYKIEPELLPETINAWSAVVGDQIPIMLMTWTGKAVGSVVGKPIGTAAGGIYAMATGGPDPHDVAAAPAIAKATEKIVKHLSGAAPLIAMEAGDYMDRADSLGIDRDISEKYARQYGLGSGAIEYAQWLWNLKAFSRLGKQTQRAVLTKVLIEIGGTTWEGVEELSQEGLQNFLIGKAIEEQKLRTPDFEAEIPELLAGGKRAFQIGFGVSLITRMPGHAYTTIRQNKMVEQIQQQTDATKEEAVVAVKAIVQGGAVAEQTKKVIQEQIKETEAAAKAEEKKPSKTAQVIEKMTAPAEPTAEPLVTKLWERPDSVRYGIDYKGAKSVFRYLPNENKVMLEAIEVPEGLQGKGIGTEIVKATLNEINKTHPDIKIESFVIDERMSKILKKEGFSELRQGEFVGRAKAIAPTKPAQAAKPKEAGLTTEEQEEYKRLKDIKEIMQKKGLANISILEQKRIAELEQKMTSATIEHPKLRQRIHAVAAKKGLTKKALTELKQKHTGYRTLTGKITQKKITTAQLQSLLRAVEKARPKRVGYKRVVTQKTEKKIQSLKENLIKKTQMTEADFREILKKEAAGKEPKYIDAEHFITETEGKEVIKRMLDEAEVIRITEPFNKAIGNEPEIAHQVEQLGSRIKRQSKRDPYSLESMRYYNQQAEVKTGAPVFIMYQDLIDTHLEINKTRTALWKNLEATIPNFKQISQDKDSLKRVSDYILSKSTLEDRPESPKDITIEEVKLAQEIEKIFESYRYKVRTAKFFNYYYYNEPIPDHERYTKEITKAVDIYEGRGKDALIKYLKTQEWGVIHSGYEPLEVLTLKIRPYTTGPKAVGKGHIKIRTDIEYHAQERNILQRLASYMRQIDMLFNMSPKINAYVRLFDDNLDKFDKPNIVKENIEVFLQNLKRYNIQKGFFERIIARAYSQAMRVIIMPSPVLSFRNLFQNAAFEHDKSILIDLRNKHLSEKDISYLETYVVQYRGMIEEYFMVGERPLPGLKFLTKLIDKIKIYPYSDIANRHLSFWAKKNQVDRALENKSVSDIMKGAKFDDMKLLEQKMALSILAKDGKEAMARYVARVHVDDIHFLYERAQRSPAEMTTMGRVLGNLMLFPRAYGEKLAHAANKMLKGSTYNEQYRGLKIIFAVVAGGMMCGSIFRKVTGRRRNPYDPLEILSYEAGGLAWGALESVNKVYADMILALKGDERSINALTSAIPEAADMFIPFYDYTLRAIEASTDQKNIDRKALRQLREMIDNEYKIRGGAYKVKRNALEKWQYFIAGAGVDEGKKKEKRKGIRR